MQTYRGPQPKQRSVYQVPSAELQRGFEAGITASGWYDYFEQVNLSGAAFTPGGTFAKDILLERPKPQSKPIAATSAYTKKSTTVDGRAMTYDVCGDRCRTSGDSDKLPPNGEGTYSFDTHMHYLNGLLDTLDLGDDVVLVGHDWGANLAFEWSRNHENRVGGIAFAEALLPPFEWSDWPLMVRDVFKHLRTPEGGKNVLDNNYFVNFSQTQMKRILDPQEWAEIVRPMPTPVRIAARRSTGLGQSHSATTTPKCGAHWKRNRRGLQNRLCPSCTSPATPAQSLRSKVVGATRSAPTPTSRSLTSGCR